MSVDKVRRRSICQRTFDSKTSFDNTSDNHFLFILPSGKLSSLILNVPSLSDASTASIFDIGNKPLTPAPGGGVHLTPANSLNRCTASGVLSGREETGTVRTRFRESGWEDSVRWMMDLKRRI